MGQQWDNKRTTNVQQTMLNGVKAFKITRLIEFFISKMQYILTRNCREERKNDMKERKGMYEYSNGDVYEGYFKKDKIHGNGVYTWANKITFRGEFKNNLIDKEPIDDKK